MVNRVDLHIFIAFAPLNTHITKCQICTLNYTFGAINGDNNTLFATSNFEPLKGTERRRTVTSGNKRCKVAPREEEATLFCGSHMETKTMLLNIFTVSNRRE